jgi:hypothetical protein
MNNEAIAAHLSAICLVVIGGLNSPPTNLSFYFSFLIFGASGAKEAGDELLYLP